MTIPLYQTDTGVPVQTSPDEATAAVLEGRLAPQKDQRVDVILKDGRKGTVAGHELSETLADGARLLDPEAERVAALRKSQSGVVGGLGAAATGLVEGATGGIGTGLARKGIGALSPSAGKAFEETVRAQQEEHPYVHTGAQIAGAAGAAYLSRGKGAGRLLPTAGIDAIGAAAERGAVRAAAGLGATGRAVAASAARGAAETALFTAGQHVGEDMLGDHEINGEKALIAGLKGGVLGLGVGAVIGGAGSLVRGMHAAATRAGARDLLHEAAEGFETKAADKAVKAESGIEALSSPVSPRPAAEAAEITEATPVVDKDLEKAGQLREVADGRGFFHDQADEAAWRAGGGNKKLSGIAEQRAGGAKAVGRTVREEGILDGGTSHAEILERTEDRLGQLGEEIGNTVGAAKVTVSAKQILKSVDEAIAPLEKSAASLGDARAVAVLRSDLYKTLGLVDELGMPIPGALEKRVAFQDLIRERRALQSRVYSVGDPNATALKKAGSEISGAWNDLEAEALNDSTSGQGDAFRALNKKYQQLSLYKKALEGTIAAGHSNHRIGLLDHVAGHGAGMIGSAVAGPLGGALGGVATALINKQLRERGNAVAAKVLGKLADLGALKAAVNKVDNSVAGAAKGLTSGVASGEKPKVRVVGGSTKESKREPLAVRYRNATKELDDMQNHPQSVAERAMAHTEDLAAHAPQTAQAFTVASSRAAAFLASKRPAPLGEPDQFTNREPSVLDTDKASFLRYFKAVKDPMTILSDFERGVVTHESAETLQAMAPGVFKELQEKVMEEVATRHAAGKSMPFKKRIEQGLLFDIDTDPSLNKATFKALQANVYTAPAPEQPQARGGKSNAPRRPVKLPNQANPLDRLAQSGAGRK